MNNKIANLFLIYLVSMFSAFGTGLSETNQGLFLAIVGENSGTNEPIRFDEKIVWLPFCTNNTVVELQHPNARYGMKMKMTDSDGKEVSRTSLGEIWCSGSKWDKLFSYKDSRLNSVNAGPYRPEIGAGGGKWTPPAKDLFRIGKTGVYTLEIQMQMFRHTGSPEPDVQHRNLICFSPVKIKVEKPPEAKLDSPLNTETNSPAK